MHRHRWFILAIILLAFALRAYRLAGQSIWYDEGLSVHYALQPPGDLLALVAASDQPPLYFLLLHAWLRSAGFSRPLSEFAVRFPSLWAGVLLVPLIYALGRRLLDRHAGLLAALLTAIAPVQVWYAQEARGYTLVVLLTALASYWLLRAMGHVGRGAGGDEDGHWTRAFRRFAPWRSRPANPKEGLRAASSPGRWAAIFRADAHAAAAAPARSLPVGRRMKTPLVVSHGARFVEDPRQGAEWRPSGIADGTPLCSVPDYEQRIFRADRWLIYALFLALALYTHFYAGFILLAHAVFVSWWAWRRRAWQVWRAWATAAAGAVAAFLPYGLAAAGELQANDTYWRGAVALRQVLAQTAHALVVGETWHGPVATAAVAAYLALVVIGLFSSARGARSASGPTGAAAGVFLAACTLIPLALMLAIAYNRPKFAPRYLLTITPALVLLAGQGAVALARWRRRGPGMILSIGLLAAVVAGSGRSLWLHYFDADRYKPDWRAVASYMTAHARPRDAVVIVAGHTAPAFDFYNSLDLAVYPVPVGLLPRVTHPVTVADVTAILNRVVAEGHDRVWLALWQEPLADPRRITLEQLFERGRRLEVYREFQDLAVLLFELPPGVRFAPPEPAHRLSTSFGDLIRLTGYDLWPTTTPAGQGLTVRLYWEAGAAVARDYTAFVQLLSADDRIVAQEDRRLGGDLYPTSRWPVGEPVRETYELTIGPGAAPGRHRLIAGVYLPETGQRLPAFGERAAGDHILLAETGPGD